MSIEVGGGAGAETWFMRGGGNIEYQVSPFPHALVNQDLAAEGIGKETTLTIEVIISLPSTSLRHRPRSCERMIGVSTSLPTEWACAYPSPPIPPHLYTEGTGRRPNFSELKSHGWKINRSPTFILSCAASPVLVLAVLVFPVSCSSFPTPSFPPTA